MKKIIITWYGMTDFRASLGLKYSTGPVLGALLAEDYTDLIILGFTNADKTKLSGLNEMSEFQQKLSEIKGTNPAAERQFLDLFSNTEEGHKYFIQWLKTQLQNSGRKIAVRFHAVSLKHLNDTEGIYEAAIQSLNTVSMSEGEKLVTLYLSPGTPVMAFVWAFAALRHPNLKKRLIASSQAGRPPEEILLPNEWLEWHGKQVKTSKTNSEQYDVIFHLFGEQRMPNLLGVLQFSSKKHVFVNSNQFPANVMKQFIEDAEYGDIAVDPYDPENVRITILDQIAKMSSNIHIGFNLTGGTKLMYAGALAACRKVNATPFYFNSRNNKVIFLNDFDSVKTKLITSVETYIKLNDNNLYISKSGHWDDIPGIHSTDRKDLTNELWQKRSKISKLYKELSDYNDSFQPFEINRGDIYVKLSKEKVAIIRIGSSHFEFNEWPEFAKYLTGGWFEEYTFMRLQPLAKSGLIKDMRIGLEVSLNKDSISYDNTKVKKDHIGLSDDIYQELDVVFTDGITLYIIECKAGNVKGEQVQKLEALTRNLGGTSGKAILACCFLPRSKVVKQKSHSARNITLIAGSNFFEALDSILDSGKF